MFIKGISVSNNLLSAIKNQNRMNFTIENHIQITLLFKEYDIDE